LGPSHQSILGNELADSFAKKALKKPIDREAFTSISYIRRHFKELDTQNWAQNWDKQLALESMGKKAVGLGKAYRKISGNLLRFKRNPEILHVPRKCQSAYIQLKTGIGYLKPYFRLIGRCTDNKCFGTCNYKQTTKHLILDCKNYKTARKTLYKALEKAGLPVSLQNIFGTRKGKEALGEFLVTTEICTANWFTNAGQIE